MIIPSPSCPVSISRHPRSWLHCIWSTTFLYNFPCTGSRNVGALTRYYVLRKITFSCVIVFYFHAYFLLFFVSNIKLFFLSIIFFNIHLLDLHYIWSKFMYNIWKIKYFILKSYSSISTILYLYFYTIVIFYYTLYIYNLIIIIPKN